ncbi:class I adenylate-forming enzyme family protein [Janthinobacterium aquaticum]|uniref:class I adenylate-forming enzyme family protein n=1 Tax=Janthinobacterium sp. FT58W TaxID=2654254 RepID=UPI0012650D96|nr:AMP-binding protein [Janthinobacterium sp. FT58W]KAB8045435.1 AMP-binding protein [Janthinobacterium sp. FT58W]
MGAAFDIPALLAAMPARLSAIAQQWAERTPHAPALIEGDRRWNYAELAHSMNSAAQLLRKLDVRPGDRVVVVGENCALQIALIFACASVDAWVVNVNARLSSREVDTIASHCTARRVLYLTHNSPEAAAHAQYSGSSTVAVDGMGTLQVGALNEAAQPEATTAGNEQIAALIYTTGTTGQPKGVMLTHRNLLFIAAVSSRLRGLEPGDRAYGVLPISHVYGLASVALGTLTAGATLQLVPRFSCEHLLSALRDGLTIVQGVPAMYAKLLQTVGGAGTPLPNRLRFAYAGGSPLSPVLKQEVEKLLGTSLHNGYGMTESSPTISQTRLDAPRHDDSVGLPIPGVDVRLVDADNADAAPGETGELWIRGPNVMAGYYREPAMTAATMRDGGWLNTGDMARQDADGALFIVGRTKELIIRSGFNVYPLEVETALNAHPGVVQSAVVGCLLADGNEDVVAYVEIDARQRVSVDDLQQWLAQHLAPYKRPSTIIVMEALPAAATGKILKGRLKQMAQQQITSSDL